MAASAPHFDHLVITCEHGGPEIPAGYEEVMRGRTVLADGRVGFDRGAPELARRLSKRFPCTFHINTANRFLVDMNRTPWNRAELFRNAMAEFSDEEKDHILARVYQPYRLGVEQSIASLIARGGRVLHLSIHSFVFELNGKQRHTDIGLLYDPARASEAGFCEAWREDLLRRDGALRVDMNEPYSGLDDGFTLHLRRTWTDATYAGIELEMNQRPLDTDMKEWERRCTLVEASLGALLGAGNQA